jgi:hypothetical protein
VRSLLHLRDQRGVAHGRPCWHPVPLCADARLTRQPPPHRERPLRINLEFLRRQSRYRIGVGRLDSARPSHKDLPHREGPRLAGAAGLHRPGGDRHRSANTTGTERDFKRWSAEKNGANHMLHLTLSRRKTRSAPTWSASISVLVLFADEINHRLNESPGMETDMDSE